MKVSITSPGHHSQGAWGRRGLAPRPLLLSSLEHRGAGLALVPALVCRVGPQQGWSPCLPGPRRRPPAWSCSPASPRPQALGLEKLLGLPEH